MGRPTKNEEPFARSRSFRLLKSEDEKFAKKLAEAGLETSAFVREYILNSETKTIVRQQKSISREDRLELIRMIGKVQEVGDTIHQVAHRADSDFRAGTLSEEAYRKLLTTLEDVSLDLKSCLPKWD